MKRKTMLRCWSRPSTWFASQFCSPPDSTALPVVLRSGGSANRSADSSCVRKRMKRTTSRCLSCFSSWWARTAEDGSAACRSCCWWMESQSPASFSVGRRIFPLLMRVPRAGWVRGWEGAALDAEESRTTAAADGAGSWSVAGTSSAAWSASHQHDGFGDCDARRTRSSWGWSRRDGGGDDGAVDAPFDCASAAASASWDRARAEQLKVGKVLRLISSLAFEFSLRVRRRRGKMETYHVLIGSNEKLSIGEQSTRILFVSTSKSSRWEKNWFYARNFFLLSFMHENHLKEVLEKIFIFCLFLKLFSAVWHPKKLRIIICRYQH